MNISLPILNTNESVILNPIAAKRCKTYGVSIYKSLDKRTNHITLLVKGKKLKDETLSKFLFDHDNNIRTRSNLQVVNAKHDYSIANFKNVSHRISAPTLKSI